MNRYQQMVREFHIAMEQPNPDRRTPLFERRKLRASLLLEEVFELIHAAGLRVRILGASQGKVCIGTDDLLIEADRRLGGVAVPMPNEAEMIDALCDVSYVTFGAAVEMGVDLDPFFDAVHAANMKKLEGPVRADGKRLKPADWKPPPIQEMLDADAGDAGAHQNLAGSLPK
jgi:predicted HAD superfamily Cof-like phosphohydrolase